ncbi:adenylosuccinate synthase [Lachnospiraceae bacterium G41]|nr:adenylosuccinate synthase [Lachnospiraceae bacterium G41]
MKAHIVIGKNFGDEGKGLATDCFARLAIKNGQSAIAVRFNGGAQAGHTVDTPCGRFVFHELSSASFRKVDTYWAKDFLPDLYKLEEELNEFKGLTGFAPSIIASPLCRIVTIDDVLLNMALESLRGKDRHGSCGMGIYEAVVRSEQHPLLLKDIKGISAEKLFNIFKELRSEYYPKRLEDLIAEDSSLKAAVGKENEFFELLKEENVIRNAAERICRGAELVELKEHDFLSSFDEIIFEGAQGLLLDTDNTEFAPHITASHTGAKAAVNICMETGIKDIEVCYISRTYVTRHGAGVLPCEEEWPKYNLKINDATNIENPWQGIIRYAPHESLDRFLEAVIKDLNSIDKGLISDDVSIKKSLFLTHLNETDNKILFSDNTELDIDSFMRKSEISKTFDNYYLSASPFSEKSTA